MGDAVVRTAPRSSALDVATPHGLARLTLDVAASARGLVLLGHGAGGGIAAPVLTAVTGRLNTAGWSVGRVEQPYRVAGRRAPSPAPHLDHTMREVVRVARQRLRLGKKPLVLGGKSSGARVACRVAADVGADAVVCLGFPLHPPGRPDKSRLGELLAVRCPVLVVQGERDAFGSARDVVAAVGAASHVSVHAVAAADHSFVPRANDGRTREECLGDAATAAVEWLSRQVGRA